MRMVMTVSVEGTWLTVWTDSWKVGGLSDGQRCALDRLNAQLFIICPDPETMVPAEWEEFGMCVDTVTDCPVSLIPDRVPVYWLRCDSDPAQLAAFLTHVDQGPFRNFEQVDRLMRCYRNSANFKDYQVHCPLDDLLRVRFGSGFVVGSAARFQSRSSSKPDRVLISLVKNYDRAITIEYRIRAFSDQWPAPSLFEVHKSRPCQISIHVWSSVEVTSLLIHIPRFSSSTTGRSGPIASSDSGRYSPLLSLIHTELRSILDCDDKIDMLVSTMEELGAVRTRPMSASSISSTFSDGVGHSGLDGGSDPSYLAGLWRSTLKICNQYDLSLIRKEILVLGDVDLVRRAWTILGENGPLLLEESVLVWPVSKFSPRKYLGEIERQRASFVAVELLRHTDRLHSIMIRYFGPGEDLDVFQDVCRSVHVSLVRPEVFVWGARDFFLSCLSLAGFQYHAPSQLVTSAVDKAPSFYHSYLYRWPVHALPEGGDEGYDGMHLMSCMITAVRSIAVQAGFKLFAVDNRPAVLMVVLVQGIPMSLCVTAAASLKAIETVIFSDTNLQRDSVSAARVAEALLLQIYIITRRLYTWSYLDGELRALPVQEDLSYVELASLLTICDHDIFEVDLGKSFLPMRRPMTQIDSTYGHHHVTAWQQMFDTLMAELGLLFPLQLAAMLSIQPVLCHFLEDLFPKSLNRHVPLEEVAIFCKMESDDWMVICLLSKIQISTNLELFMFRCHRDYLLAEIQPMGRFWQRLGQQLSMPEWLRSRVVEAINIARFKSLFKLINSTEGIFTDDDIEFIQSCAEKATLDEDVTEMCRYVARNKYRILKIFVYGSDENEV